MAGRWKSVWHGIVRGMLPDVGTAVQTEGLESDAFGVSLSIYDYFGATSVEDNHGVSTACLMSEDAEGEGHRYACAPRTSLRPLQLMPYLQDGGSRTTVVLVHLML
jgi:hypothetical protein